MRLCCLVCVSIALVGCGSSPAGGHADPNLVADAGPAPEGGGPSGACLTSLDYVIQPQKFGSADMARQLHVDGANLFFRTLHGLWQVPVAGGTPTLLTGASSGGPDVDAFWIKDQKIYFVENQKLMTIAESGGTPSQASSGTMTDYSSYLTDSSGGAVFDGARVLWAYSAAADTKHGVRSMSVATGAVVDLVPPSPDTIDSPWIVGDNVYYGHMSSTGDTRAIASVPAAGGTPTDLPIKERTFGAADASGIYYSFVDWNDGSGAGFYRANLQGGAATRVVADPGFDPMQVLFTGTTAFFGGATDINPDASGLGTTVNGVYQLPNGGSSATLATCVDTKYTLHAIEVAGSTLYLSIFETATGLASIVRVPLHS